MSETIREILDGILGRLLLRRLVLRLAATGPGARGAALAAMATDHPELSRELASAAAELSLADLRWALDPACPAPIRRWARVAAARIAADIRRARPNRPAGVGSTSDAGRPEPSPRGRSTPGRRRRQTRSARRRRG